MSTKKSFSWVDLEKKHGPMTLGMFLRAFRQTEGFSQAEYARRLGISRANLCDIELGRKPATPTRAARIASKLGVPTEVLVQLAIQDVLRMAKLNFKVELSAA